MKIKQHIFLSSQEALIKSGKDLLDSLKVSTVPEVSTQITELEFYFIRSSCSSFCKPIELWNGLETRRENRRRNTHSIMVLFSLGKGM